MGKEKGPSLLKRKPEVVEKIIDLMALGLPLVPIAKAFGVSARTLHRWKERKDFGKRLAERQLEMIEVPWRKVRDRMPLAYLERHIDFRNDFAPPGQGQQSPQIVIEVLGNVSKQQIPVSLDIMPKLPEPEKIDEEC